MIWMLVAGIVLELLALLAVYQRLSHQVEAVRADLLAHMVALAEAEKAREELERQRLATIQTLRTGEGKRLLQERLNHRLGIRPTV